MTTHGILYMNYRLIKIFHWFKSHVRKILFRILILAASVHLVPDVSRSSLRKMKIFYTLFRLFTVSLTFLRDRFLRRESFRVSIISARSRRPQRNAEAAWNASTEKRLSRERVNPAASKWFFVPSCALLSSDEPLIRLPVASSSVLITDATV